MVSKKKKDTQIRVSNNNLLFLGLAIAAIIIAGFFLYFSNTGDVVAKVNGEKITLQEVEREQSLMEFRDERQISFEEALNQSIENELIYQEAENIGLVVSKEEALVRFESTVLSGNSSLEDVKRLIEQRGDNYEDFMEAYRKQLAIDIYLENKVNRRVEVTDQDARKFYEENKEELFGNNPILPYELVADQLKELIRERTREELYKQVVQELRDKADIKIIEQDD